MAESCLFTFYILLKCRLVDRKVLKTLTLN